MRVQYFQGLNGLRFIAAFLVLVFHAGQTVVKVGFVNGIGFGVVFERGAAAVDFFFTLSGFLITYLLLQEQARTGTVSLARFYIRRMCRIWPLYFLILAIGFLVLGVLYPHVFHVPYFEFPLAQGLLLYIVFLPNYMRAFYKVGLLSPLWSIGVEEQFYLFWAPVVKVLRHRLVPVVLVFTLLIAGLQILASFHIGTSDEQEETFVQTLRFHYMGVGALFAYALFSNSDRLLNSWVTAYWFQGLMLFALFYYYAVGTPPGIREVFLELPLAFLYAALIMNVSLGPRRWMNLEWNPLSYLGKISYGIYMFHMPLDYCVRTVFTELHWIRPSLALGLAYGTILLVVTIAAAHVSYQYFEKRFLALAEHKA